MGQVAFTEDGPRVLSVYEGFFAGGARVLHTGVVRALHSTTGQHHRVLSLTDRSVRENTVQLAQGDASHRSLVRAGVPVTALRRGSGEAWRPGQRRALQRAVSAADVVLTLKEQPLLALADARLGGRPVLTCLHRSDPEHQGRALETLVSLVERGTVRAAICCAHSTQAAYHAATGIPLDQLPVVPNGTDLRRFRPCATTRAEARGELGVVGEVPVVLFSARFDPMKDVALFVRAAARFRELRPDAHLVLCGAGMSAGNAELVALLAGAGLASERVHLLGIRTDVPRLCNAADLVVITSAYGEAAPLALLEGMACGAVPVTTDVGDAALMVGEPRLVAPREATAMADTWVAAYEQREEHAERILRRRQRLSDQRTYDAYAALIREHAAGSRLDLVG
ncbi:glycosyltransferase [Nocardioides flavescens]|uniref:Glycosyltransferase n=1 Tax=Nocardioides flavescens TaxID=2691959 RepID=A0A6L7EZD8_9ACTN|nr:glycosyltransferase [Nocardioides flavescens]MXG91118.1 glycosyltransferase [Nocardioides flavescens]